MCTYIYIYHIYIKLKIHIHSECLQHTPERGSEWGVHTIMNGWNNCFETAETYGFLAVNCTYEYICIYIYIIFEEKKIKKF